MLPLHHHGPSFKQIVDAVSYNRQISYGWIFMKLFGKCIKWDKEQVVRCWGCDLAIRDHMRVWARSVLKKLVTTLNHVVWSLL